MDVERLLPEDAVRPIWSSASALVYCGGIVALFATGALTAIADDEGGSWAFVGAALVAGVVAFALAEALAGNGRAIAAGVTATIAVVFAGVGAGAVLDVAGVLDVTLDDYEPASLVVEAVLIAGSLAAVRRYRAPLPVLVAAVTFWVAVADLASLTGGERWDEILSLAAGALLAATGALVDRAGREAYGFWLHAVGGAAAGGAVVALAGDSAWPLVAAVALGFVAVGFVLARSSYSVLGAIGILIATTLFVADWDAVFSDFPFGTPSGGDSLEGWQIALSYLGAGLLIAGIGVAGGARGARGSDPVTGDP